MILSGSRRVVKIRVTARGDPLLEHSGDLTDARRLPLSGRCDSGNKQDQLGEISHPLPNTGFIS